MYSGTGRPGTAGGSRWCHGFCQRENKVITIIILHRTTSAKTRATATLRQRHIPPNVRCNLRPRSTKYLIMKKLTSLIFILISLNIYCQVDTINKSTTDNKMQLKIRPFIIGGQPDVMLVYKNSQINLDSITLRKIDPKWVRRFKVLKEKDFKSIHGDLNGTILLYPKRRYLDQIQTVLNK